MELRRVWKIITKQPGLTIKTSHVFFLCCCPCGEKWNNNYHLSSKLIFKQQVGSENNYSNACFPYRNCKAQEEDAFYWNMLRPSRLFWRTALGVSTTTCAFLWLRNATSGVSVCLFLAESFYTPVVQRPRIVLGYLLLCWPCAVSCLRKVRVKGSRRLIWGWVAVGMGKQEQALGMCQRLVGGTGMVWMMLLVDVCIP